MFTRQKEKGKYLKSFFIHFMTFGSWKKEKATASNTGLCSAKTVALTVF